MNKFIGYGRIYKELEIKQTQNGVKFGVFGLAIQRPYKQNGEYKADFIPCETYNEHHIKFLQSMVKGTRLVVEGELNIESWQENNEWKNFTKIKVNSISFVETREERNNLNNQNQNNYNNNNGGNNYNNDNNQRQQSNYNEPTPPPTENDLPF